MISNLEDVQRPDHADPILRREINYNLPDEDFKINNIKIWYRTENAKVLLLTDDKDLIRDASAQFHGKALYTMNISQFNEAMNSML